jgi:hypothetical protein
MLRYLIQKVNLIQALVGRRLIVLSVSPLRWFWIAMVSEKKLYAEIAKVI